MDKKKKIIIISAIIIVVLALIIGIVYLFVTKKSGKNEISKVQNLYETLKNKNSYAFETILDDNNKFYYAKLDDKAYTDTIYKGNESKYIIKDGNSYLLVDDMKAYYTYANNEIDLNKIEVELQNIKDQPYEKGKEKIDNKEYFYEEYKMATELSMGIIPEDDNENIVTRFYFKGDKLEYIKTIKGEKQELLKVDILDNVNKDLFEIPSDYQSR